jgi:hypothetical protein
MRTRVILAVIALVVAACGDAPEAAGDTIAVHGDWTIEVYNDDGSLDERVEFTNALSTTGEHTLVRLLTGTATASGDWTIDLTGSPSPCPAAVAGVCRVTPITSVPIDEDQDDFEDALQLAGSLVVEADGVISLVTTNPGICGGNQAPDDCPSARGSFSFTSKVLSEPPSVSAGQTVQVEVVISFTSG